MNELIERLEAAEWYCEAPCNGPIWPYRWYERALHWLCFLAVLHLIPVRWSMKWPFRWMLPYCGNYAYTCKCPHNIAARIAALRAHSTGMEGKKPQ